jgi:splicing factor 3A subunit 1
MQPPAALPAPGKVEIRKYDPKVAQATKKKPEPEEYLVSPITGEKIPASKVQEHMRIGLLDPRWVDERDKQITARAAEEQVRHCCKSQSELFQICFIEFANYLLVNPRSLN